MVSLVHELLSYHVLWVIHCRGFYFPFRSRPFSSQQTGDGASSRPRPLVTEKLSRLGHNKKGPSGKPLSVYFIVPLGDR